MKEDREAKRFARGLAISLTVLAVLGWVLGESSVSSFLPRLYWQGRVALLALAGALAFLSQWRPRAILPLYRLALALTRAMERTITLFLLALVYFGMLTPLAWFFRARGRDTLRRRRPPPGTSMWEPSEANVGEENYLRPF